ncbi:MAG: hypothetical protein LKI24_07255 [Acidipropionibacterium sp.]|nr:hypothetical protein [Acidipropionibacterium sp.]
MWGAHSAGFAIVTILVLIGVPDSVLLMLGMVTLWALLYFFVTKKPYWQYVIFLSMTVVLVNSAGMSTVLLDGERMGFTFVGAVLTIMVAVIVDLVMYHRIGGSRDLPKPVDDEPTPF